MNAIVESRPFVGDLVADGGRGVVQPTPAPTPMHMLQAAMEKGADLATLEKLMDLQDRWEKKEAEKAFASAITQFKQNAPDILKRKRVHFEFNNRTTDYMHAELSDVCEAAIKGLAAVGISHRWDIVEQTPAQITVECVLTHVAGHSQRTRLSGAPDPSGSKNAMQAIGSAVTYLQRYTLLAATGLATRGMDTDARVPEAAPELITANQAADLEALLSEYGGNREAFLRVCKINRFEDMPAAKFAAAVERIKSRKRV